MPYQNSQVYMGKLTTAWIAANSEVSGSMYTIHALHGILKRSDSLAVGDQSCGFGGRCIPLDKVSTDVALDAARIVAIAVLARVPGWSCVAEYG
jgi:hypothetical protein